jgi:hypothetical protein
MYDLPAITPLQPTGPVTRRDKLDAFGHPMPRPEERAWREREKLDPAHYLDAGAFLVTLPRAPTRRDWLTGAAAPATAWARPRDLDLEARLLRALLAVPGRRGLEGSHLIALVRTVAAQAGAPVATLDELQLAATAVVVAALEEGPRAVDLPSRARTQGVLAGAWPDYAAFLGPLLDAPDEVPQDSRGVVLGLCFEVAAGLGAVPTSFDALKLLMGELARRYPAAALASLEIVLSPH